MRSNVRLPDSSGIISPESEPAPWEVVGLAIVSSAVYLALEPYARRVWPETLIGWNRLMAGRLRDPLVGGEVLFGTVAGTCLALLPHLRVLVTTWLGLPPPILSALCSRSQVP